MRLHGVHIGAVEHILVGIRIVFAHPLDEIVLPHHLDRPRHLLAGDELRQQLAAEPAAGLALGLHARQICRSSRHSKPLAASAPPYGSFQDIMAKAAHGKRLRRGAAALSARPKKLRPGLCRAAERCKTWKKFPLSRPRPAPPAPDALR